MFRRRGESGLEHQAKTAWLALAFMSNFPDFFRGGTALILQPQDIITIIATALTHDSGEPKKGDYADDGSEAHDSKVREESELSMFNQMLIAFNSKHADTIRRCFIGMWDGDEYVSQAIKALDKLDAVLTDLVQESISNPGSLKKKRKPTGQDLKYMELTKSDLAADIWGRGALERIEDFPPEITEPVLTLLAVAVRDVRDQDFSWLEF